MPAPTSPRWRAGWCRWPAPGRSTPTATRCRISWALIQRPAGSRAALANPAGALTSFTADRPGTYLAQLIVNDGRVDSAPDTVTITTGNTAPVAVAGPDRAGLFAGSVAALDGTGSTDADGHALSYRWSLLSVPAGSAAVLSDAAAPSPWFTIDRVGQYVAQLIVNDGFQDGAPDTVVVTAENRAPSADAGSDQSLFLGAVATLSGAASSDPDGDALTYQWVFHGGPRRQRGHARRRVIGGAQLHARRGGRLRAVAHRQRRRRRHGERRRDGARLHAGDGHA